MNLSDEFSVLWKNKVGTKERERESSLGLHPNEKNLESWLWQKRAWLGAGETHSKANMVSSPFHPTYLMQASHSPTVSGFKQMRLVEAMPGDS